MDVIHIRKERMLCVCTSVFFCYDEMKRKEYCVFVAIPCTVYTHGYIDIREAVMKH